MRSAARTRSSASHFPKGMRPPAPPAIAAATSRARALRSRVAGSASPPPLSDAAADGALGGRAGVSDRRRRGDGRERRLEAPKVADIDLRAIAEEYGGHDQVLQLADVPGPALD